MQISDTAYNELTAFEARADAQMRKLSIWGLPYRSVYSAALLAADTAFSGGRFTNRRQPDLEKGGTMLSRYSYWRPYLQCCTKDIGADIADILSVVNKEEQIEISEALLYSHFCELMPFVHRKVLMVAQTQTGFRLIYPSDQAARFEALDVIASELALTAIDQRFKYDPLPLMRMVANWPQMDLMDFYSVLGKAYAFYLGSVHEDAFLGTLVYERVLGFRHDEFIRVRAAMMAFASWCLGMANAAEAHAIQRTGSERDRFGNECLEWLVPFLNSNFFKGTIEGLSKVPKERLDKILSYFEDDPFAETGLSGEGYLAPLSSYGSSVLISPRAIHHMTPERNILYVLNKIERHHFDDMVSAELEPSLLAQAKQLIDCVPGLEARLNVKWHSGEIDLIAYCQKTNTAIQIQAKAAVPAVGARMTRQLETNTKTAVKQLESFETLPERGKDNVVGVAFGVSARGIKWSSGVLSRSSFGSASAWAAIGDRAAINLPILQSLTEQLAKDSNIDLSTLPSLSKKILETIADKCILGWEDHPLNVFDVIIIAPILKLDNDEISRLRMQMR